MIDAVERKKTDKRTSHAYVNNTVRGKFMNFFECVPFEKSPVEPTVPKARPVLLSGEGECRQCYRLCDGRIIHIYIDDMYESITVRDDRNQEIGEFNFALVDDFPGHCQYLLTGMSLDKLDKSYLRKGIGRLCLEIFRSLNGGCPITARPNDGLRLDDGSHLTGDGPSFVQAMQWEGLIQGNENEYDENPL